MRLTDNQVKDLKAGFLAGTRPIELARRYDISVATVYKYIQGRSRKATGDGDLMTPQNGLERGLETQPGAVLKGIRGLLGITQAEFARALGKSNSTIGNWETGLTRMRLTDRRMLARWLADNGLLDSTQAMIRGLEGDRAGDREGDASYAEQG